MDDEPNRLSTSANMLLVPTAADNVGLTEAGDRGDKALARLSRIERKRAVPVAAPVSVYANVCLRPRREKIFGPPPVRHLDGNAKARVWAAAAAYNASARRPGQHQGPLTWATLRVLRVLLFRFHGADGGGRCFPAYEKLAAAARCARSSVAVALHALEETGLLTWVHRLARQRRQERDLFGKLVSVWQVIRVSNGYTFGDPLDREPGRKAYKSENPTGPTEPIKNQKGESGARLVGAPIHTISETADALLMRHGWFRSGGKG